MIEIILVSLLSLICKTVSDGNSSTYYKEYSLRTDQLCPDLQESVRVKDIDTANYPYKSVFRLVDQLSSGSDPCIFESKGPKRQITTVLIRAIHADYQQWNYSGAQPCGEHIKLKLPNVRFFGEPNRPLCTVTKPLKPSKDGSTVVPGPSYHPQIWQVSRTRMGIRFSMSDQVDKTNVYLNDDQPLPYPKDFDHNRLPRFVQVIFSTYFGDSCSLRVQQYLVDTTKEHCNISTGRYYPLCGQYDCLDEEALLGRVGFWSESVRVQQIQKLIEIVRTKHYRNYEPSFADFLVGLLRLLIMPLVFLLTYYVTKQIRDKFASNHILQSIRASSQVQSRRIGVGRVRTSSVMIDSPTAERRDDPPPSYDTIITPPSYQEATTNAKKPSDNNTTTTTGELNHSINDQLPSYSQVYGLSSTDSNVIPPATPSQPTLNQNITPTPSNQTVSDNTQS